MNLLAVTIIEGPVHADHTKSPDLLAGLISHGPSSYEVAGWDLASGVKMYPDRPADRYPVKWNEALVRWRCLVGAELRPEEVYFWEAGE